MIKREILKEAGIKPIDGEIEMNQDIFFAEDEITRKLASRRFKFIKIKRCMIYPDDRFRGMWDSIMTM
jgi:hypothetical protein